MSHDPPKPKSVIRIFTEATLVPLGSVVTVMITIAGGTVFLTEFYRDFKEVRAQVSANEAGLASQQKLLDTLMSDIKTNMAVQNERTRVINERLEAIQYGRTKARN